MGFLKKWNKKKNIEEINNSNEIDTTNDIEKILGVSIDDFLVVNNEEEFKNYMKEIDANGTKVISIILDITEESELLTRKEIILEILSRCGMDLKYVSDDFKSDSEVIETAFNNDPHSIQFAKKFLTSTFLLSNLILAKFW